MKHPWTAARAGKLMLSGVLVLALLLLPRSTALASSTWYVDGVNGNDNNDCLSPQTACKTIGHAISLAASGDTIMVAAATYIENLTIPFSLTIQGAGATTTIIDGGKKNRVVTIPNRGSVVRISDVTIQNGYVNVNCISCNVYGGGIFSQRGNLTIANSNLSGNSANASCAYPSCNAYGGGVYNTGGKVTISYSTLSGNSANVSCSEDNCSASALGGGVYNTGGRLTISHSTLSQNTLSVNCIVQCSPNTVGGGIFNDSQLTVSHSTVSGNDSGFGSGGGIYNVGTMKIDQSTLSGNIASALAGGGAYNGGTATIDKSTFSGNKAFEGGGLTNCCPGGPVTITNSTFSSNVAVYSAGGGAIQTYGPLTLTNSTLSGNSASGPGGGILSACCYDQLITISSSTLAGNSAIGGRDLAITSGTATIQNSIVANSPGAGNCYIYQGGSIVSNGYNLSSDRTCPFHNTGDLNHTDPKLGPLQSNGGPTQTMALLRRSRAIDAGNPNGCTDGNGNLLTTDQRGKPRPDPEDNGIGCDMGAYELQRAP